MRKLNFLVVGFSILLLASSQSLGQDLFEGTQKSLQKSVTEKIVDQTEDSAKYLLKYLFGSVKELNGRRHHFEADYDFKYIGEDFPHPETSSFGIEAVFGVTEDLDVFVDYGLPTTEFERGPVYFEPEGDEFGAGFKTSVPVPGEGVAGELRMRFSWHHTDQEEHEHTYDFRGNELDLHLGLNRPFAKNGYEITPHLGAVFKYIKGDYKYSTFYQSTNAWRKDSDKYLHESLSPYLGLTIMTPGGLQFHAEFYGFEVWGDTIDLSFLMSVGFSIDHIMKLKDAENTNQNGNTEQTQG